MFFKIVLTFIVSTTLFISACDSNTSPTDKNPPQHEINNFIDTGDLNALKKHGVIRLLRLRWEEEIGLPRKGLPNYRYRLGIEHFIETLGLQAQWVTVDSFADLTPALLEGRGDIIISNLTHTPKRENILSFSLPIDRAQEFIVTRSDTPLDTIESLQDKRIAIRAGTSFQSSLLDLLDQHHDLTFDLVILNGNADPDSILDQLNQGDFDATVMDSNLLEAMQSYRKDFHIGIAINKLQNIALAVRPNSSELLHKINTFLLEKLSERDWDKRHFDDWNAIKKRKLLRVLTHNNPASYFLWRGELMGFDYELIRDFANKNQLKLEMVVAPPEVNITDWLLEGRGDLIAAAMTDSQSRRERGLIFSSAYSQVAEQLLTSNERLPLDKLKNLSDRALAINPRSNYWKTAQKLQRDGHQFTLTKADDSLSSAEIIAAVARGEYDATLADSHLIDIEQRFDKRLSPGLELTPKLNHAWGLRPDSPNLLKQLNQYLKQEIGSKHFNVIKKKYFSDNKKITRYQGQRLNREGELSPYDSIVKPFAAKHQFDWRLITAQMYQESRFNPKARSHVGALGLMQVMPRTARSLNYKLPFNDKSGIEAGIRYLAWVRERFEDTLQPQQRIWFSLAAYNAGAGHVKDARRLAKQQGLDPDIWFDNVDNAMLLLAKRKYYKKARYGYVRGSEPVKYVRQIRKRYQAYLNL